MSKKRLMRRAATILAGALVLAGCTQANPTTTGVQDVIKAKSIVIVDGHGKERIRLDTREYWPNGPSVAVIHLAGDTDGTEVEIAAGGGNGARVSLQNGKWLSANLAAGAAGQMISSLSLQGACCGKEVSDEDAKMSIYMDTNPYHGPKLDINGPRKWGRVHLAVDDQRVMGVISGRDIPLEGPSLTMFRPGGKHGYWVGIAPEGQERGGP